jgi:hypothetical protein
MLLSHEKDAAIPIYSFIMSTRKSKVGVERVLARIVGSVGGARS